MTHDNPVLVNTAERVATVTFNRPEKRNAIDLPTLECLINALERLAVDDSVRVVILKGAGKTFSAGADQGEMIERAASEWQWIVERYLDPVRIICRMNQPVIAAIRGDAVGGGLGLALACDFRIASAHSRFCAPFIKIGLAGCDMSTGYFLPRLIGLGRATDMMMTGRFLGTEEAERIGLIHQAVSEEELEVAVDTLARQLAAMPPVAMTYTKSAIRRSVDRDMSGEFDYEVYAQIQCLQTKDHRTALAAFQSRQPAVFKGC